MNGSGDDDDAFPPSTASPSPSVVLLLNLARRSPIMAF